MSTTNDNSNTICNTVAYDDILATVAKLRIVLEDPRTTATERQSARDQAHEYLYAKYQNSASFYTIDGGNGRTIVGAVIVSHLLPGGRLPQDE